MPGHFTEVSKDRKDHFKAYWGDADKAEQFSPYGLLSVRPGAPTDGSHFDFLVLTFEQAVTSDSTVSSLAIPHLLALVGEFDPQDEVVHPTTDFVKKFQSIFSDKAIDFKVLRGHNHLSPIAALMSGDAQGEHWGEELAVWILGKEAEVDEGVKSILRGPTKVKPGSDFDRHGKGIDDGHHFRHGKHDNDEKVDINREGGEGGHGKAEKDVKGIETNEHITPKDTA